MRLFRHKTSTLDYAQSLARARDEISGHVHSKAITTSVARTQQFQLSTIDTVQFLH